MPNPIRSAIAIAAGATILLAQGSSTAEVKLYSLESADSLVLHNVAAEPVRLHGLTGIRLTLSDHARRSLEAMTPQERNDARLDQLARIKDIEFSNGVIEVELAGAPAQGASAAARGFIGVAFRVQPDNLSYDAFYLRPTNGRAADQERRNRSTQYISHPDWPWFRLRKETPAKYESYVDLVPGQWTKLRIEVAGSKARLYIHGNEHPALVVNDVKSGAHGKGAVALWLDTGTVAHFRNLRVTVTSEAVVRANVAAIPQAYRIFLKPVSQAPGVNPSAETNRNRHTCRLVFSFTSWRAWREWNGN